MKSNVSVMFKIITLNILISFFCVLNIASAEENIGKKVAPLSVGTIVPVGGLEAIGTLPGCTATLVTQDTVLTAAHCVCANGQRQNCSNRATFTLHNVMPATGGNRKNISISGNVHVHPQFGVKGWLRDDYAVVKLDTPIYKIAPAVKPIPIEQPFNIPQKGENLTLVGYGITGPNCKKSSKGKMKLTLPVYDISSGGILFRYNKKHSCPGDSGGPALNSKNHVVGVASWGNFSTDSTYRPTHSIYDWIFGLSEQSENGLCSWNNVEKAGISSHQRGASWCKSGSLFTALDLDGDRRYAATDTPVIGSARCCNTGRTFSSCSWLPVYRSHQQGSAWCSQGSFITALDLDGGSAPYDYPIVGSAKCCKVSNSWGKCLWVEVGAIRSHQSWSNWCPAGTYITALDLDSEGKVDAHDSPIVGRAMCCSLGSSTGNVQPPPPSPTLHGGPIAATASANPSVISRGQQTSINVYAQDSQGRPLPSATVTLSSGGGRFSQTGTTTVSGPTDSSGAFRAFWSCDLCAPAYVGDVRITKPGYEEAKAQWRVEIH